MSQLQSLLLLSLILLLFFTNVVHVVYKTCIDVLNDIKSLNYPFQFLLSFLLSTYSLLLPTSRPSIVGNMGSTTIKFLQNSSSFIPPIKPIVEPWITFSISPNNLLINVRKSNGFFKE